MTAAQLLTDLARLGIRIEAHNERLRYSPRSAVTPDLARRMKACKGELLAILWTGDDGPNATTNWEAALDPIGDDGWPINSIDAHEVEPCGECGSLELWKSLLGRWRCQKCDPPAATAQELKEKASRLRNGRVGLRMASARARA